MATKNNPPKCRENDIVTQDLKGELLIYDLTINKAYCLNETSALVFQLCDGTNSVAEISDLMSVKLKTLVPEDLVWLALIELKKQNLLENEAELTNHFAGLTRREIVKKVGLVSMVALPIIASVVAPSAVTAASLLANRSACTAPSQCQSGNCTTLIPTCCQTGSVFGSGTNGFGVGGGQVACNSFAPTFCCVGTTATFTQAPAQPVGTGNCACS